jgi:hypothetical protein
VIAAGGLALLLAALAAWVPIKLQREVGCGPPIITVIYSSASASGSGGNPPPLRLQSPSEAVRQHCENALPGRVRVFLVAAPLAFVLLAAGSNLGHTRWKGHGSAIA